MQTTFDIVFFKTSSFKNCIIGQEIDGSAGFLRLSHDRRKSVDQFGHRNAPGIGILIDMLSVLNPNGQSRRKRVDNRRTHAMQASAGLIGGMIELSSGMQRGEHQPLRAHTLLVHPHRDAPPVVRHRCGTVLFQDYRDLAAKTSQMLVHGVVHDFVDQMIQPSGGNAADIHSRPHAHGFQPFQYGNAGSIICSIDCHSRSSLPNLLSRFQAV